MTPRTRLAALLLTLLARSAAAQAPAVDYRRLGHDILRELVAIRTTENGVGSTPAVRAVARRLAAAGFPAADLHILGPSPRKQNLVARLRGRGRGKPILFLGHIDVVDARRQDWSPEFDPFRLTEKDGWFYGRGTQDMKGGAAILVANFIRWKREGWVPERDLVLALTADEEAYGDEIGAMWLVRHHPELVAAEFCLNADGGDFQTKDGVPAIIGVEAGEKQETLIELAVTNRGGHASIPRSDNAIYQLNRALDRIRAYRFQPNLNPVSRAALAGMARLETGRVAADLAAAGRDQVEPAVLERLSEDPYYNAIIRTTCVPTMINGGLGPSALPQFATALVNCRVLPGETSDLVRAALERQVADSGVAFSWKFHETGDGSPSPLDARVVGAITDVAQAMWPGIMVMPGFGTGMSDSRFFRRAGIPSYGVSGLAIEQGDVRAHGRDERIRVADFDRGIEFMDRFVRRLLATAGLAARPGAAARLDGP